MCYADCRKICRVELTSVKTNRMQAIQEQSLQGARRARKEIHHGFEEYGLQEF